MKLRSGLISIIGTGCILFSVAATKAENSNTFFVGLDYALGEFQIQNSFTTHEVHSPGASFGLILPITDDRVFISYKGAATFHGVTDVIYGENPSPDDEWYYRNLDQYIGSFNGLFVGARFDLSRSLYVKPMLGVGVLVHIIYGNHREGIAYGSYQLDATVLAMYELGKVDIGTWFTFGYVPYGGYFERVDLEYLSFGLAISI